MAFKRTGNFINKTKNIKLLLEDDEKIVVNHVGYYPNGKKVQDVALMQEYGTNKIPPRPALRQSKNKYRDKWQQQALIRVKNFIIKNKNLSNEKKLFAKSIRKDIQQSYLDMNTPALSESTLWSRKSKKNTGYASYDKGFDKPLYETGRLYKNIRVKIIKR